MSWRADNTSGTKEGFERGPDGQRGHAVEELEVYHDGGGEQNERRHRSKKISGVQ